MNRLLRLFTIFLLLCSGLSAYSQEVLAPSKIRGRHKNLPSLGLPIYQHGEIDAVIQFKDGCWHGADSLNSPHPHWTMQPVTSKSILNVPRDITPVMEWVQKWANEKPSRAVDMVYGPFYGGWYIALCKKTGERLIWRSIGLVIPFGGPIAGRSMLSYSHSINWLEHRTGYNFFPKLPSHLQEIIEEMTVVEWLSPVQEFETLPLDSAPDQEIDTDWQQDYLDSML